MGADRILAQLLGSGAAAGFVGGAAGGLLTSKAGRKLGKKALKLGGVAAVGGLAYVAWARWRAQQEGAGAAGGIFDAADSPWLAEARRAGFLPPPDRPAETDALGVALLRVMIAAARADGRLDGREREAILARVAALDLGEAERAMVWAALEEPVDLDAVAAAATSRERAAELYAAALLAIDVDTPAERGWLGMLAARLSLPDELVAALHAEAGVTAPGAPAPPRELARV
jgi:uncharacterized membrane protein YebE (DUF533 family)